VSAVASLAPHAYPADIQRDIVRENNDIFHRYFIKGCGGLHSL
jgi:hypothetical protein